MPRQFQRDGCWDQPQPGQRWAISIPRPPKQITHLCLGLHGEIVLVKPTLSLCLSCPSPRSLALALANLGCAVPVPNTAVSLIEQLIPGNIVDVDIQSDESKVPREEWVQLEQTRGVYL
jgi:hypothetical protein